MTPGQELSEDPHCLQLYWYNTGNDSHRWDKPRHTSHLPYRHRYSLQ